MRWFRFYHEALHDPKVLKLTDREHRHWVNVLCIASQSEPRGSIPAVEDVALHLRTTTGRARGILERLVERGLLDKDERGYRPHNWEGRQRPSDDVAARVRKSRYGPDDDDDLEGSNVTCNVTDNVTVSPQERERERERYLPPDGGSGARRSSGCPEWLEAPLPRGLKVAQLECIEAAFGERAPSQWVRDRINDALNHKAVDKAKRPDLYLRRWLDRDLKDAQERRTYAPTRTFREPPPKQPDSLDLSEAIAEMERKARAS